VVPQVFIFVYFLNPSPHLILGIALAENAALGLRLATAALEVAGCVQQSSGFHGIEFNELKNKISNPKFWRMGFSPTQI